MQTSTETILSCNRPRYTYDEYLALETFSNVKHEYLDGVIYALPFAVPEEAALAAAVVGLLFRISAAALADCMAPVCAFARLQHWQRTLTSRSCADESSFMNPILTRSRTLS